MLTILIAVQASPTALPVLIKNTAPVLVQGALRIASPLPHIQLDKVEVADSGWVIFAAFASAAAAGATVCLAFMNRTMALQTTRLADETKALADATAASVKVTQDSIKAEERRHLDGFMPCIALTMYSPPGGLIELHATNIGTGFAQDIRVTYSVTGLGVPLSNLPTALGAGAPHRMVAETQPNQPFATFALDYEDAFGRKFRTSLEDGSTSGIRYKWEKLF